MKTMDVHEEITALVTEWCGDQGFAVRITEDGRYVKICKQPQALEGSHTDIIYFYTISDGRCIADKAICLSDGDHGTELDEQTLGGILEQLKTSAPFIPNSIEERSLFLWLSAPGVN